MLSSKTNALLTHTLASFWRKQSCSFLVMSDGHSLSFKLHWLVMAGCVARRQNNRVLTKILSCAHEQTTGEPISTVFLAWSSKNTRVLANKVLVCSPPRQRRTRAFVCSSKSTRVFINRLPLCLPTNHTCVHTEVCAHQYSRRFHRCTCVLANKAHHVFVNRRDGLWRYSHRGWQSRSIPVHTVCFDARISLLIGRTNICSDLHESVARTLVQDANERAVQPDNEWCRYCTNQ